MKTYFSIYKNSSHILANITGCAVSISQIKRETMYGKLQVQLLEFNGTSTVCIVSFTTLKPMTQYDAMEVCQAENTSVIDWSFMGHAPAS